MNNITVYSHQNPMPRDFFSRLYRIIEYSFPRNERRSFEEHFREFDKEPFRSLVYEENSEIAGFMNYWELPKFVYLEHFAVASERRGRGLGHELMGELRSTVGNVPTILEAEPPELDDTAARRIGFYKRLGFALNMYEYFQPPYHKGEQPVRLMLMSAPSALTESEFKEVRSSLYRDVYGINTKS